MKGPAASLYEQGCENFLRLYLKRSHDRESNGATAILPVSLLTRSLQWVHIPDNNSQIFNTCKTHYPVFRHVECSWTWWHCVILTCHRLAPPR